VVPLPQPKRLLFVPPRFVGDALLSVPLLRQLKEAFPDLWLGMVAPKAAYPLLEACPYLDLLSLEPKSPWAWRQFYKTHAIDTLLSTRSSAGLALVAAASGVPNRVGFAWQRTGKNRYKATTWGLTQALPYPPLATELHQTQVLQQFLSLWGVPCLPEAQALELWPKESDWQTLLEAYPVLKQNDLPLAVVHLSAASEHKAPEPYVWPPALQKLAQAGYFLVFTGQQGDNALYEQLVKQSDLKPSTYLNLAGQSSLSQLLALLKRAQLLLSLDSAPVHMASAVNTPKLLAFYGATNPKQWGVANPSLQFEPMSLSLPCKPCQSKVCATNNCRTQVTASHVLSALNRVL
jgi:heptosyltransferase III